MDSRALVVGCVLGLALRPVASEAGGETVVIEDVGRYEVIDPLFEGVRVMLAHRGEEYSASYIQGITGMAFHIAGPCPCAPTSSAPFFTQDFVKLLGYEFEHATLTGEGLDAERDVSEVVARVKEEIRDGRPALVWHAFTNAEWDVVFGFDEEEREFLGCGTYRGDEEPAREPEDRMKEARHICPAYGALLIGERTGEYDARAAELAALEEAIRHAHAPRDRFLEHAGDTEPPWRFREGLACYEAWAHKFRVDPDRVPDGPGDRYPLGCYHSTRSSAAPFLREIAPRYPEGQEHLLKAAAHFEQDAAALEELCHEVFGGWDGYQEPDPQKAARSAELLTEAGAHYKRGIKEIEHALAAIDPERVERGHRRAVVERTDGRVAIRGVRPLNWGSGRDCTFAGALEEALRQTAHPYTYSDLMGLTGLAFRVRWCNDDTKTKWCPSVCIGEMPEEHVAAAKLTGWSLPTDWLDADGRDNEALRARVVAEINAGRAIVAYPPLWNMGLVYGYEDEGRAVLVNDYIEKRTGGAMDDREHATLPLDKLGPLFTFLGEYADPPPLRDCLVEALQTAVHNWKRERHHGGLEDREYWYGDAAMKAWIKDLREYDAVSDEGKQGFPFIHWWNLTALYDARKAAVSFLKDWSTVVEGEAREALTRAAELYEKETEALKPHVPEEEPEAIAAGERERAAEALDGVRRTDAQAVAELERALEALGAEE